VRGIRRLGGTILAGLKAIYVRLVEACLECRSFRIAKKHGIDVLHDIAGCPRPVKRSFHPAVPSTQAPKISTLAAHANQPHSAGGVGSALVQLFARS
jgi:hypothetical protein